MSKTPQYIRAARRIKDHCWRVILSGKNCLEAGCQLFDEEEWKCKLASEDMVKPFEWRLPPTAAEMAIDFANEVMGFEQ